MTWVRRHGLALAVVAVLLPATLWTTFADQWLGYFESRPSRPVDVVAGETVEYGGYGWQIESTDRFSAASARGQERDLPAGTDLVVVTVRVDPGDLHGSEVSAPCTTRLEETGGDLSPRSWGTGTASPVDLAGIGPELSSCSSELLTPYTFAAEFVVPADAGAQASLALGIAVDAELPEYARLALD